MPEVCSDHIDEAVADAVRSGQILLVAYVAKAIAARCGGSPERIAEELTRAGIRAGVTMRLGKPA